MVEYIAVSDGTCSACRGMGACPTYGNDVPCMTCGGSGKRPEGVPSPVGGYYFNHELGVVIGPDPKGTASTPEQAIREARKK